MYLYKRMYVYPPAVEAAAQTGYGPGYTIDS